MGSGPVGKYWGGTRKEELRVSIVMTYCIQNEIVNK